MSDEKTFKILAIDGGGIKGLYSAKIIEHLEKKFECHISNYFDLICGTSTGGLIALALSIKMPAEEIVKFYEEKGPIIFPSQGIIGPFKQVLFRGKYGDKNLRKVLKEIFQDKKIGDVNNLLCIPSYSLTDARPWVFKFDHPGKDFDYKRLSRDNKAFLVDVALATSAAPTYFPLTEISYYDHKQFIDGGVWANNPTMVGFIEALKFFVGKDKEFQKLDILSISNLSLTGGRPPGLKRHRAFVDWRNHLLDTFMNGQSFFTNYFMDTINEVNDVSVNYFRIPSADISSTQEYLVRLDNASKKSLRLLKGKGNDQGDIYSKKREIAKFFENQKLYKNK